MAHEQQPASDQDFWRGRPTRLFSVPLAVLALGAIWIWIEILGAAVAARGSGTTGLFRRFLDFLPWQLGLFALFGVTVAAIARIGRFSRQALGWIAVGLASWVLLGARVGEGVLRRGEAGMSSLPQAMMAVLATAVVVAVALWIFSLAPRLLPRASREILPLAAWLTWSIFFLQSMAKIGPSIAGWGGDPGAWLKELDYRSLVTAIACGGGLVVLHLLIQRRLSERATRLTLLVALSFSVLGLSLALLPSGGREPTPETSHSNEATDVIVILVDTLRADYVGRSRDGSSLTPALDSLAAESITFTNAFSPGNNTRSAMPGVLTSLPWEAVGSPMPESVDTFAEHLHDQGFGTAGISSNPFISRRYGYQQGFGEFLDPIDRYDFLVSNLLQVAATMLPGPSYGAGLARADLFYQTADSLMSDAAKIFRRSAEPAFLYVQLMDPHGPYLPPKGYLPDDFRLADFVSYYEFTSLANRNILRSEEFRPRLENLLQRYRAEISYMDHEVGRFMDEIRETGRFEEALIWVLSDHGEAFGEEDWAGHNGKNMNNAVIQVPFIVKPPKSWGITPRREPTPVSTSSLMPTTLSLLGLRVPQNLFGEDLSALIRSPDHELESRTVISQGIRGTYAGIRWPWKLILTPEGHQIEERRLFHLADDPGEAYDLANRFPDLVAELQADLERWKEDASRGIKNEGGPTIDEATREQLRNLGYIE